MVSNDCQESILSLKKPKQKQTNKQKFYQERDTVLREGYVVVGLGDVVGTLNSLFLVTSFTL